MKTYSDSRCELKGSENIRKYILGGRGVVTLESITGVHRSYSFRLPKYPEKFEKGTMFVYTLADNNEWVYTGMYSRGYFQLTRASKFKRGTAAVRGAEYIARCSREDVDDARMKFYHEGVCGVCGRKLTHPESIRAGIGPRCRGVV